MSKLLYSFFFSVLMFSCTKQSVFPKSTSLQIHKVITLGGSKNDAFLSIKNTLDGGYIAVGHTQSNNADITDKNNESYDYWVVKFDAAHTLVWKKTFGGSDDDRARDVLELADGTFLVTGFSRSNDGDATTNNGNYDFWVVKISSEGNVIWEKNFGFSGADQAYTIQQTSDGNILLGGTIDVSASEGQGNFKTHKRHAGGDYWLIKIDGNGNNLWSKYFGGQFSDTLLAISETNNGDYILTGSSDSKDTDINNNIGGYDFWIVKVSSTGTLIWEKNFGGSQVDDAFSITKTTDDHFLIVGNTRSSDFNVSLNYGSSDIWVIKINTNGELIWETNLGGSSFDNANKIIASKKDGFYIVGSSRSIDFDTNDNFGNKDVWIVKINSEGKLEWQKNIGGTELEEGNSITELNDGTLIVAGKSWSSDNDIPENKGFFDGLIIVLK